MAKAFKDPFALKINPDQRKALALWFSEQINDALNAKSVSDENVDYYHQLYEQARTRTRANEPWPDAADLTSYLPCEKVDAIVARGMRTIWTEPIWTVEGWGQAADRAPFVEEFHQWKAEEERLQSVLDRLWLIAMIEPRGLIEVYEDTTTRTVRKTINAAIEIDPLTQSMVFDDEGNPSFQTDERGQFVEAQDPNVPAAETTIDSTEPVRLGPQYRVLPYRDSIILPGHAREKQDIWGYGKRFWKRVPDIKAQAEAGVYDQASVDLLTETMDTTPSQALQRSNQAVVPGDRVTAEKELWECLVLVDLNAILEMKGEKPIRGLKGPRWYVITEQIDQQQLLRIEHDDFERSRYVPVILFPRPDRATEGFSFIGHKLITTTEEHTAWRNMSADRGSMVLQAPIKRQQSALWDPMEQPFGPKAVIDVRAMNEVEPVQLPEFGLNYADARIQACERTAERLAGVNDIASGSVSAESRTLGEVNMATEQSFVRMDLIVRRFQEAMEDIFQIRHAIWKRTLAASPDGVDAPQSLVVGMEGRGVPIEQFSPTGKITATMLEGSFRGKPYGSVQTADPSRRRQNVIQFMQALPQVMPLLPAVQGMLMQPAAQRALWREFVTAMDFPNRQALLGSPAQDMAQSIMPMGMPGMGMMPPGMINGGPSQQQGGPMPGPLPPNLAQMAPSTNTLQ